MGALGSLLATIGLMLGIRITVVVIKNLGRIAATIYQIKVQVLGEVKDEPLELRTFVESELEIGRRWRFGPAHGPSTARTP